MYEPKPYFEIVKHSQEAGEIAQEMGADFIEAWDGKEFRFFFEFQSNVTPEQSETFRSNLSKATGKNWEIAYAFHKYALILTLQK